MQWKKYKSAVCYIGYGAHQALQQLPTTVHFINLDKLVAWAHPIYCQAFTTCHGMISLVKVQSRFNQKAGQGLFLSTFSCGRGKKRKEMPFHFIISFADAYSYFQLGIVTTRVSKKEKESFLVLEIILPHICT